MSGILLIIQFVLAVIITIIVLLQKSSSIGLGAYSGSNESLFGAKGPAGFLAKTTFVLGFLLTCWFLLYVVTYKKADRKIFREFIVALFASIYLGLGSFFLILSFGINV